MEKLRHPPSLKFLLVETGTSKEKEEDFLVALLKNDEVGLF